jgi:hypothetical protein
VLGKTEKFSEFLPKMGCVRNVELCADLTTCPYAFAGIATGDTLEAAHDHLEVRSWRIVMFRVRTPCRLSAATGA